VKTKELKRKYKGIMIINKSKRKINRKVRKQEVKE